MPPLGGRACGSPKRPTERPPSPFAFATLRGAAWRSVDEREPIRDPSQLKRPLYVSRTAHEQELPSALGRDTDRHICELDPGRVHEVQPAEVKHNRLRSALECRHQGHVKLVSGGKIQLSAWLYDVPVGTTADTDRELGLLANPELFGEAHIDTSAWELSEPVVQARSLAERLVLTFWVSPKRVAGCDGARAAGNIAHLFRRIKSEFDVALAAIFVDPPDPLKERSALPADPLFTPQIYLHADIAIKERALALTRKFR